MSVILSGPISCGNIEHYITKMKEMPLFSALSDDELKNLMSSAEVIVVPKDELLVSTGDYANSVIFLADGKVKYMRRHVDTNREKILWILSAPELLGIEAALSADRRYTYDMISLSQATLIRIPLQGFMALLDTNPSFRDEMLKLLTLRIHMLMDEISNMTFYNITERLVMILYSIVSESLGEKASEFDGEYELDREMSLQDIASLIGTVREVVARAMASLERQGVLRRTRKKLFVNVKALRERYSYLFS